MAREKSIRTDPRNHADEGDERIRTAVPAPGADSVYEVSGDQAHDALDLLLALSEEWCNGCKQPRSEWGPVCPGMTQGDYTHFHSREWWLSRRGAA